VSLAFISKIDLNSSNEITPSFLRSCFVMMSTISYLGTSMPSFCMAKYIFS
jgi:hypothetical protein